MAAIAATPKRTFTPADSALVLTITLNISFAREIDRQTLIRIFKEGAPVRPWLAHLEEFFSLKSTPYELIQRFMREYDLSFDDLARVYDQLPDFCRNRDFDRVLQNGYFEEAV